MRRRRTKIPNSLREHRRLMGYTQGDIMLKLQLESTSMISRWERGMTMPSADNLLKLSILYKTLVNELYYDLGTMYQMELFQEEAERLSKYLIEDFPFVRGP